MEIVVGLAAFAIVAGWAALSWLRHGRDPDYGDDPSILQAAPPPEMTAATATIVGGGSSRVAFEAALLDLASRDEIAFRQGTGADGGSVGIEIHGGSSTDPVVLRNRRRPVGEGEAWLLGQLRLEAAIGAGPSGEAAAAGGMVAMLGSLAAYSSGARDGTTANAGGMLAGATLDPEAMATAYASRHGRPMPADQLDRLRMLSVASSIMAEPGRFGDPAAVEQELAARGVHLTEEQDAGLRAWLAQRASAPAPGPAAPAALAGGGTATPGGDAATGRYISPALARALPAPIGFASLVESYARRHGWIGGLSFVERWKWRALGAVEAVAGLLIASAGGWTVDTATALGVGIGAGGVATWLLAPAMPARTASGAMMVAQLQAYARTLRLTFGQARSMADVVGASGLAWLETPDQVLVWGVALGLRPEIEALLQRSAGSSPTERPGAAPAYVPAWYRPADDAPARGTVDPARMFAAIEAVGTQPGGLETLAHAAEAAADAAPPVGT